MVLFPQSEFQKLKNVLVLYNCALTSVVAKLDILNEDYDAFHEYNPIEHIKYRIKTPESIAAKLYRHKLPITAQAAREKLFDIAGARVICSFAKEIYEIADSIKQQKDVTLLRERDYIVEPKPSGYRSYHMTISVPVYLTGRVEHMPVELQIRTAAMDFWASLEHKVRYKYEFDVPPHLIEELKTCSDKINDLDGRMFMIHEILGLMNSK